MATSITNENGSSSAPALPPSKSMEEKEGSLTMEVLSVYDLPNNKPPSSVTLTVGETLTGATGPPQARHKDRNSFRFSSPNNNGDSSASSATVKLVAPLRTLYESTLTVRVTYADEPKQLLEATYDIQQLRIQDPKWLILNLSAVDGNEQALTTKTGEGDEEVPPTIRLKMTLTGPFRPEVAALITAGRSWFGLVDKVEDNAVEVWNKVPKLPSGYSNVLVLPAVPLVATFVVASPVVAGVVMVGLPFFLPLVLLLISLGAALMVSGGAVFFSTHTGRGQLAGLLSPLVDPFLSSRAGQRLVYNTGPRPTPVSVARQMLPAAIWARLAVSLLIDMVGSSSYLLPGVGEGFDLAWAPIQTVLIMAMYDSVSPNLKYVSFAEEILPFTDIVPTATIGWAVEFVPQLLGNNPEVAQVVNTLVAAAPGLKAAGTVATPAN